MSTTTTTKRTTARSRTPPPSSGRAKSPTRSTSGATAAPKSPKRTTSTPTTTSQRQSRSHSPVRGSTNSANNRGKSPVRSSGRTSTNSGTANRGKSPVRSSSNATSGGILGGILEGFGHSDNDAFEEKVRKCIPSEFQLLASQDDRTQALEDWYAMEHYNLPVNRQAKKVNAGSVATSALLQIMYENPRRMIACGETEPWNCLEILQQIKKRVKEHSKVEAKPTMSSSRPLGPPRRSGKKDQYAPFYIVPPGYTGKRHALLIAVRVGEGPDLKGSHNDISCMQSFLRLYCGFKEADITVMKDDDIHTDPTKRNILAAFTKLCRLTKRGDVVFIQFSGHGGRTGNNLYICPSDYKRGPVMDEVILRDLIKALPGGVYTTMLVDCCYSGTVGDLPYVLKSTRDGARQEIESYFDTDSREEMMRREKEGGQKYQDFKRARAEQRSLWRLGAMPAKLVYDAANAAAGGAMMVGEGVVHVGMGTAQVAADAVQAAGTGVYQAGNAVGTGVYQAGNVVGTGVYQAGNVVGTGVYQAGNVVGTGVYQAGNVVGTGVYQAGNVVGTGVYQAGNVVGTGVFQAGASVVGAAGSVVGAAGTVAGAGTDMLRRSGTGVASVAGAVAVSPFRRSNTETVKRRSNTDNIRRSNTQTIRRTNTDNMRDSTGVFTALSDAATTVTSSVAGAATTVTRAASPFRRSNTETVRRTSESKEEEDFEEALRKEAINRSRREAAEARARRNGGSMSHSHNDHFDCPVARARPEAVAARLGSRSKSTPKRSVTAPKKIGISVEVRQNGNKASPAGRGKAGKSPIRRVQTLDSPKKSPKKPAIRLISITDVANSMTSAANAAATSAASAANAAATTATSAATAASTAATSAANAAATTATSAATAASTAATTAGGGLRRTVTAPVRGVSPMRTRSTKRSVSPMRRTTSLEEKKAEEQARKDAIERSKREAQAARAAAGRR
ncbi:Metacaspase-1B [Seminavis robusta]|uniref:Metacaspase-1B n=1 Tax=Seminavis robusta TaxID=568900 RepID=A0A9N8EU90_9STRA|nr:Metacaspase-1B [Seminavis robusta]|eukprot:Sro1701_g292220.1 Metacaspase-1B (958) ;mRNA; f:19912-22785